MRVGALRHFVEIYNTTNTRDSLGGFTEVNALFATAWADITPISGNEKFIDKERHATATHKAICRYIAGIKPEMILSFDGRKFNIKSALDVGEKRKMLTLVLEERL